MGGKKREGHCSRYNINHINLNATFQINTKTFSTSKKKLFANIDNINLILCQKKRKRKECERGDEGIFCKYIFGACFVLCILFFFA